jgi:hypothetical protein
MRALTDHEKRTIRVGGVLTAVLLAIIFGWRGWTVLEKRRADYRDMITAAEAKQRELQVYEDKAEKIKELMERFKMDPARLTKGTVVAEASDAIQKAGSSGGVQFGPIRETHGRTSAKELAAIQLEGNGQLTAVMGLLHRMQSLGYPLIIDSVQITRNAMRPGMVKVNMTVLIMDFEAWKAKEAPSA